MKPQSIGKSATGPKLGGQYHGLRIAAWTVAACMTWLSIIYLPRDVLGPTLDSSIQGALSHFAEKQMQFGREVMFTYGPLGYLVPEIYDGTFFNRKLIYELLSKLLIAAVVIQIARQLPFLSRVLLLSSVWILAPRLGNSYPEVLFYFAIAATGLILSRDDRLRRYFLPPLLVFLAFVSLIKFTLLAYSFVVVLLLSIYWAIQGNWKTCLSVLAAYGALVVVAWTMAGQMWVNFPTWIFTSVQVASGYQQCLGINPEPGILHLALGAAAVGICLFGVAGYALRRNLSAYLPVACLLTGYWTSWKHGLVRADDHVNIFFGFCLLGFLSFPAFVDHLVSGMRVRQILSGVGCLLCLAGIYIQDSPFLTNGPSNTVSHLFETTRRLLSITNYKAELNEQLSAQRKRFDCPRTRAEVGTSTIDVFGHNQGIALLNDLNYHPRPAFQSYVACTQFLIRANAEFYRSDNAPAYVISSPQSVDDRFPAQDDAEALRVLLLDYELVSEENGWLLWRRSVVRRTVTEEITGADAMETGFNREVQLSQRNLWSRIDIRETALGKLRSFFYKPPILFISVTDEDHVSSTYRILPPIARSGFILDPYLGSQSDIIGLKTKFAPKPKHISSFRIVASDSYTKYWAGRISIHLSQIAPFAAE